MNIKKNKVYILGAGGFAREVLNIFTDLGAESSVRGFIEESISRVGKRLNGKDIHSSIILNPSTGLDPKETNLICAIGTPLRKRWIEETKAQGYDYIAVVHPSTINSRWITLGEGVIICAGNILTSQISIGNHSIINLGCTIGHDVSIGKYTTVSPGVHISGKVTIGDECFIGTGSVIVEKVSIGNRSFIGAGAVVTKDIPEDTLAMGVPAKLIRTLTEEEWRRLI
ncbi:MAG: acetyltransferase [Candidatus Ratteibacteria bacterium]|nr:acetyltransferase [Candidatus Ratteibacteria bacterium]